MNKDSSALKGFPSVDKILSNPIISDLLSSFDKEFVMYSIRQEMKELKSLVKNSDLEVPGLEEIALKIMEHISTISNKKLRKVINCTGIVVHTNIGRAPFGKEILDEVGGVLEGYNNLEFDLDECKRGSRHDHLAEILKYLTGGEDVMVVNNNAAALMLILRTFSRNRETIVSRGELIEIGGSFRLPEILEASDALMKEVGTTNKTHFQDYAKAISADTALLLKAHQSNYTIEGFTDEVTLNQLVELGKKHKLPVVYDMGSGLFRKMDIPVLSDEPVVKEAMETGIDLVCFSGDKLLGGPQAGIIAGKKKWIEKLKKEPMARALRVDKVTIALMESVCAQYLDSKSLQANNEVMKMLLMQEHDVRDKAVLMKSVFDEAGILSELAPNSARSGGGSLPGKSIKSFSLKLILPGDTKKQRSRMADSVHRNLLKKEVAILSILRKGELYFDALTIKEKEFVTLANAIMHTIKEEIAK